MSGFRSVQGIQSIGAIVSFLTFSGHASGHSSRSACDRAWPARNERRRNDLARVAELADQPIKTLSGWSRLLTERQRAMLGRKAANKLRYCRIARFDLPEKPHFARPYAPRPAPPRGATSRRPCRQKLRYNRPWLVLLASRLCRPAGQPSQCASRASRRLTARTYGLRQFAALMNLSCVFPDQKLSCWEGRKLRHRRNATRAPRSCEPKRLEGNHHFSGSERNLGGELSGERFF